MLFRSLLMISINFERMSLWEGLENQRNLTNVGFYHFAYVFGVHCVLQWISLKSRNTNQNIQNTHVSPPSSADLEWRKTTEAIYSGGLPGLNGAKTLQLNSASQQWRRRQRKQVHSARLCFTTGACCTFTHGDGWGLLVDVRRAS